MFVRHAFLLSVLVVIAACSKTAPPEASTATHSITARFATYAPSLEGFARSHNLHIDKYYYDSPQWSFCFEHPRGGQAKIDLTIGDSGVITLETAWWVDNYREFTRSLKYGEKVEIVPNSDAIVQALDTALAEAVRWERGEWSEVADGYRPIWGQLTEAQFRAATPKWPRPTL